MTINLTVKEISDKNIWSDVCDIKNMNPWIRNEGMIQDGEIISLTPKEFLKLGLSLTNFIEKSESGFIDEEYIRGN